MGMLARESAGGRIVLVTGCVMAAMLAAIMCIWWLGEAPLLMGSC